MRARFYIEVGGRRVRVSRWGYHWIAKRRRKRIWEETRIMAQGPLDPTVPWPPTRKVYRVKLRMDPRKSR